jgi:hypothetical protein
MCSKLNLITKTHPETLLCQLSSCSPKQRNIQHTILIAEFSVSRMKNPGPLSQFLRSYCIHDDATSTFRSVTIRNTFHWVGGEHYLLLVLSIPSCV